MARPKMKFEPEAAYKLVGELYHKLNELSFCEGNLNRGPDRIPLVDEAREAFKPLRDIFDKSAPWSDDPVPFPAEGCVMLQQWLQTYMSERGWNRMLAAKRQRKASRKSERGPYEDRETTVTIKH